MVEGNKKLNFLRGLLYLSPCIILLAIFTFYPLIKTFVISLNYKYNYLTGVYNPDGWGFKNYELLFQSGSQYPRCLAMTCIIVFISVPISLFVALLIAVALNAIKPLQKFLQTIFFLPYVTNTIAIGMVFSIMFESQQGLANTILNSLGGSSINWLGGNTEAKLLFTGLFDWLKTLFPNHEFMFGPQDFTSLIVLLVYIIWNSLPFKVLILLSSLQGIDKQYYQAAQIDNTSKARTFFKITVPLLSPQIFYLLITAFIGAFKEYTSVVAIFGDKAQSVGKSNNMATVVWYVYSFVKGSNSSASSMGRGAAGAVVLFIIIMVFTVINKTVEKKKVHY